MLAGRRMFKLIRNMDSPTRWHITAYRDWLKANPDALSSAVGQRVDRLITLSLARGAFVPDRLGVRALLVALVLLGVTSCGAPGATVFELESRAGAALVDVETRVGGKRLDLGRIEPGAVSMARFDDSDVRVVYQKGAETRERSCKVDAYITTGHPTRIRIVVDGRGQCRAGGNRRTDGTDGS